MKPERWQRIEHLYHAALERDADQRASFLAEACADDVSLRREIEALLAANDEASSFLAAPALELEAKRLAAETPAAAMAVEVGQELSHYKILSRIGAGGMGEVFLAQDKILERFHEDQHTGDKDHSAFKADRKELHFAMPIRMIGIFRLTGEVNTIAGKTSRHHVDNGFQGIRKDGHRMGHKVRREFRHR